MASLETDNGPSSVVSNKATAPYFTRLPTHSEKLWNYLGYHVV